ncbi:polyhydroxyalkanoate synthesis regulator DNA-binding domain-containing protein [Polyangium sorediatum]|uniref:Polyhydroxyalkanoate synthesis regulator DNA-binding domain-containing protein n=1 Tax=Polyangium sorediatum TaxID=889274 RepID=A0ABT6NR84_9BACT|nr:polyhydroxyalkanoate synthesis regulator DNA-binding domain-containing protein [Polyangium sorediatum]MDI1430798.1 polyhydroxyalkanoate synthesis regulator DNA-binding domain-containing protein [Polyangium sorediatum]
MDTVKETSGASATPRRVIKRYSNRKLYDTKDSRYVTLQQIGEMVRAGEEVQIIDNATKEDKTEVTLALIISEDLKSQPRSVPLGTLRDLIQERGERLLNTLREGPIGRLIPGGGTEDAPAEAAAPATPDKPPTQPPPAPAAAVAPAEADKPAASHGAKARLSEIVESSKQTLDQWQHAVDERIRHILPGVGLFRDLQADVHRLSQRVEELEAIVRKLGGEPTNTPETPEKPETSTEE